MAKVSDENKKVIKNDKKRNNRQNKTSNTEKNNKNKKRVKDAYNWLVNVITKNKLISLIVALLLVIIIIIIATLMTSDRVVMTIGGTDYTKKDYMIYLYSVKYNYFGEDNMDIPDATLNSPVDENSDITLGEYLKEKTTTELKIASAIKKMADENNITITSKEEKELREEKAEYIDSLGGKSAFKKLLKENNTDEESYDKMARTDKLYELLYDNLYAEGKLNDLTDEQKSQAKIEYEDTYIKLKQVILTIVDLDTNKTLSETVINQKQALANTILEKAKSGQNFDELISKYSEDAEGKEPPYDLYYKKGELLEELENAVGTLDTGGISNVIKTKYAFHIIQRQALDDAKLNDFYDEKRSEKLLEDIYKSLDQLSVIYQDEYDKLKIN